MAIIARHGARPIVAVVPDNQDPGLRIDPADPRFWDQMRELEASGTTIAMHGYRHQCASRGKPLLPLHTETEFAGVEESVQRQWIRTGLAILRGHGLSPRLFVAPRHGFDRATLRVLSQEGLGTLSDGFTTRPYIRGNVLWLPQQLWEPVVKPSGLWTICIHTSTAPAELDEKLNKFLEQFAHQVTNFDSVLQDYPPAPLRLLERLREKVTAQRIAAKLALRRRLKGK